MRYFWAAYKQGALDEMHIVAGLDAQAFGDEIAQEIVTRYDGAWTMLAETPRGFLPVGAAFAHWAGIGAAWMLVDGVVWFPWASTRNKVESTVSFFRAIHYEVPMMGFARSRDRKMYEICADHGVMRRVGTSSNVFDGPATIFETRALQ